MSIVKGALLVVCIVFALACDNTQRCYKSSDCCAGNTCYEKNQYWSGCKTSCDPNWVDPYDSLKWSCKVVGSATCGAFRDGYDVVGTNLVEKSVASAQECCDLCNSMSNCQAAALWNNICYPKAGSDIVAKAGVTAIVKTGSGNVVGDVVYCPTSQDMNLESGTVTFANGGWEMTGGARVSSKTSWNLLGGYMEWDMDLTRVADGVNTNFYTSSPSRQNCGSACYCDIQKSTSFTSCMELDFMENNGKCLGNTALHMYATDGVANNANCDRWGCNSLTAKYSTSQVHYRAEVGADGYVKVFVNGVLNTNYSPAPSASANTVVVNTMKSVGAVIESSQWYGWVPGDTQCPTGNSAGLTNSVVRVYNVKVKGTVVQGPVPNKCA